MNHINKNENYTTMSKVHLQDKNLSLKAKGLMSFMLSLPKDWDCSFAGLVKMNKESKWAIKSALKELAEQNYLKRTLIYDDKGESDYIYILTEEPQFYCTKQGDLKND